MTGGSFTALTVNAGSSSIRLGLFRGTPHLMTCVRRVRAGAGADVASRLTDFLDGIHVDAVAHRVVHGGPRLGSTCRLDADVVAEIERACTLAPSHNPRALEWIAAVSASLPAATAVAVFDHGFFGALPAHASTYALPAAVRDKWGLRRLGFHGIAHRSMWETFAALPSAPRARVISFQLGNGCSAAALRDGAPIDTSMGFTPLGGMVMGTRPGNLDPGVLTFLMRTGGMSLDEIERMVHEESGLAALSGGISSVEALLETSSPEAELALAVYCYSARKTLGAYLAALGGCDAVLFGGGVGENAPRVRATIVGGLDDLGIVLDPRANASTSPPARISTGGSAVAVWVIPTDEESVLAREAAMFAQATADAVPAH